MLCRPGFPVRQIGNIAFKVAVLISLRNPRTFDNSTRAILHSAIACDGGTAAAIWPRNHLPTGSSAECAIFQGHICRLAVTANNLAHSIRACVFHGKRSALGKLWKEIYIRRQIQIDRTLTSVEESF